MLAWVALAACWWGYLAERRRANRLFPYAWRLYGTEVAVAQAIADLDGSHYVNEHGDMCAVCGAADGSWPCAAREVAEDLRRAVEP